MSNDAHSCAQCDGDWCSQSVGVAARDRLDVDDVDIDVGIDTECATVDAVGVVVTGNTGNIEEVDDHRNDGGFVGRTYPFDSRVASTVEDQTTSDHFDSGSNDEDTLLDLADGNAISIDVVATDSGEICCNHIGHCDLLWT